MKPTTVLGLAWSPANHLFEEAASIIEKEPAFDLCQEVVAESSSERRVSRCVAVIAHVKPSLVLLPLEESTRAWTVDALRACTETLQRLPVLLLAGETNPKQIVDLLEAGAEDFVAPPIRPTDLLPRVWRLSRVAGEKEMVSHQLKQTFGLKGLLGESPAFLAAIKKIPAIARCDATVLIMSETGTGKELCARAIHYLSARANRPFVPINCGAIPIELVENELFGHEPGAFTGANSTANGLFRGADGGTVLLDEVDTLSPPAQVKLLRFLQDGHLQPLGSSKPCTANVRIIAATNSNLAESVRAGRFRRDLYYRLNVVPLQMPPLRDRREDIPLLTRHFLDKYSKRFKKPQRDISSRAQQMLLAYDWPGNVRELENVIERAVVFSANPTVQAEDIGFHFLADTSTPGSFKRLKARTIEEFERRYIQDLLLKNHGNITRASQAAGKNRRAFWQLMRKHGLVAASRPGPTEVPPVTDAAS